MTAPATYQLLTGDWIEKLRTLPDHSVHVVATSPPYWSLRDYGVDGQLGLEASVQEWCWKLVVGFREVKRVLREDGLLWVNLGDCFAQGARGEDYTAALRGADGLYGRVPTQREQSGPRGLDGTRSGRRESRAAQSVMKASTAAPDGATWGQGDFPARLSSHGLGGHGCKEKDLVGQPWMFAFAMREDGWSLRMDCIWEKANPMPESVDDRPTKSHEFVFLFSPAKWIGPRRRQFAGVTDDAARWLALLIDTEGNICVRRHAREDGKVAFGIQVAIGNTHRDLLERAQRIVGAGTVLQREGTNAPMFYYQLAGHDAADLLHRVYPFLIVKPRQAALAMHVQEQTDLPKTRPGGRRHPDFEAFLTLAWSTMKQLNHFASPDLSWVPVPEYGRWSSEPTFWVHRDRGGTRVQPEPDFVFRHRVTKEERRVEPAPEYVWVHKRTGEVRAVDAGGLEDAVSSDWRKLNLWRRVNLWEGCDYWYDADAVREPYKPETIARRAYGDLTGHVGQRRGEHQPKTTSGEAKAALPRGTHPDGGKIRERALYGPNQNGRNKRSVWGEVDSDDAFVAAALELIAARHELSSVWDVPTPRFGESHFATFPPDLVKPCIFASTSEAGACEKCGAALRRVIEKNEPDEEWLKSMGANKDGGYNGKAKKDYAAARAQNASDVKRRILEGAKRKKTVAWRPTCNCWDCEKCGGWGYTREHHEQPPCGLCGGRGFSTPSTVPCVVMDPFSGSGTTGVVALTYGRSYVGIELNPGKGSQETAERRLAALVKQPGLPFQYAEGE